MSFGLKLYSVVITRQSICFCLNLEDFHPKYNHKLLSMCCMCILFIYFLYYYKNNSSLEKVEQVLRKQKHGTIGEIVAKNLLLANQSPDEWNGNVYFISNYRNRKNVLLAINFHFLRQFFEEFRSNEERRTKTLKLNSTRMTVTIKFCNKNG